MDWNPLENFNRAEGGVFLSWNLETSLGDLEVLSLKNQRLEAERLSFHPLCEITSRCLWQLFILHSHILQFHIVFFKKAWIFVNLEYSVDTFIFSIQAYQTQFYEVVYISIKEMEKREEHINIISSFLEEEQIFLCIGTKVEESTQNYQINGQSWTHIPKFCTKLEKQDHGYKCYVPILYQGV